MTPTKALLGLAALAAASIAFSAAQACGPMQGEGPSQGGGAQGGSSRGSSSQGGFGGGASQGGGGGGGGWDNAGAEQIRQGADAATRGDGGDDGAPRRAQNGGGGGGGQNYSNQISTLGASDASDAAAAAPPQNTYDGTHAGGDSLESIKNDWAVSEAMMNGGYITEAWKTWNDLPWWQRYWQDEPLKYRPGAPKMSPTDGYQRDPEPGPTGGPSVWEMLTGQGPEQSLKPATPAPPAYEDPQINPDYKAWLDLPWYSKLITDEPPHKRPGGAPAHVAEPHAGARG